MWPAGRTLAMFDIYNIIIKQPKSGADAIKKFTLSLGIPYLGV